MDSWILFFLVLVLLGTLSAVPLCRHSDVFRRLGTELNWAAAESRAAGAPDDFSAVGIRPLASEEREGFAQVWRSVEGRFATDPKTAVIYADLLVSDLMDARGLPAREIGEANTEFPLDRGVAESYRIAHQIAVRHRRGDPKADHLRKAMAHYRDLIFRLLDDRALLDPALIESARGTARDTHPVA
jgi:hypothetical protein